jgi:hypothetical protein
MSHENLASARPILAAEQDDYSAAARTWIPLIEPGMLVAGVAGDVIGEITEVRASDFLVDRSGSLGLSADGLLSVPYERIHVMLADKMTLDLPSSQLDQYATSPSTYTR